MNFSLSNPIRRNTTRARGRSYKKEKVIHILNLMNFNTFLMNIILFIFQHAVATAPNTPSSANIMANTFRFEPILKKHTIF